MTLSMTRPVYVLLYTLFMVVTYHMLVAHKHSSSAEFHPVRQLPTVQGQGPLKVAVPKAGKLSKMQLAEAVVFALKRRSREKD